ncbi:endonuclease/exonuclease/phosphatase family protein [Streptomyces caniferus]|uniref:endonuclease/exonuclease/phosphatase family protein n=1 Tax=Streptomyces caniferus TaxID=285557 RepID=UPI00381CD880
MSNGFQAGKINIDLLMGAHMNRHVVAAATAQVDATRAVAARSAADPSELTTSVLTFNIHHAQGTDGVLDLERIARVIRSSGADIVGLQEVDRHFAERSNWADQATKLAEVLGYHLAYGANIDLDPPATGNPRIQYGTAILSRHPITRWDNTHLFRSPDEEQRGLLHAEVDMYGTPVHVYNTHLELFSESDRLQQAKEVAELIGDMCPAVLLGDFNASPQTPEIETIRARFTDAWTALGGMEVATFPADAPNECIDYIFTNRWVTPKRTSIVTDDLAASDHVPVFARLAVGSPP